MPLLHANRVKQAACPCIAKAAHMSATLINQGRLLPREMSQMWMEIPSLAAALKDLIVSLMCYGFQFQKAG